MEDLSNKIDIDPTRGFVQKGEESLPRKEGVCG